MWKIILLYLIILQTVLDPVWAQSCPVKCSCSPSIKGLVVSCGPGLASFPANVPAKCQIFSIGAASSLGSSQVNNIPSLSNSNFASFTEVVIVHVAFSNVQSIVPGTFSKLSKLIKLDLKGNKISSLSRSMLTGLSRLEHLVLSDNVNCILDQNVFNDLTSLKTLELGALGLKTLGNILTSLTSLETLDLHGNDLVRLEYSSFVYSNSLKFLDVSFNDLYEVQKGMRSILTNLKSLRLDYNPWRCNCAISWLKSLPGRFVTPLRGRGGGLICDQPTNLSFRDLVGVPDKDLSCIPARILSCNSNSVTVLEGQRIHVTCEIQGDPYPDITWIRPDGVNVSAILMTSTKDFVNLSIPASVYTKHDGQWTVVAENCNGISTQTISISIATTTAQTTPTTTRPTTTTASTSMSSYSTATGLKPASSSVTSAHHYTVTPNSIQPGKVTTPQAMYSPAISKTTTTNPFGSSTHSNRSTSQSSSSSSSIDPVYIIIIVAASLSSIVFLTGTCLFAVMVHKSKRNVRISAKRRSVYSKQGDDFELGSTPVPPTPLHEMINFKD